jgi:peptidyl-prolyl cis-trans isomerase C
VLRSRLLSVLFAAPLFFAARSPRADIAPDAASGAASTLTVPTLTMPDAHRQAIVAHVGARAISAGDLEDRLARIPRYQLRTFGTTAPEVVRGYFDKVFLREVLLSLGAEEKHLDQRIDVEQGLDRMLSSATLRALIAEVGPNNAVTPEEVQAYYDANRARFETRDRVSIWRILCGSRAEAQTVLDQAKKDGTVATFTKLSRDHNIDKATFLRGGNLGFVGEGGVSSEPGLVVDAAVLKAAQGVKDGEIVPTVVREGMSFAVVWRRGSQAGTHRSVVDARPQIQDAIVRQKREVAQKALLEKLRAEKVKDVDESLLGSFDISIDDGTIGPRNRTKSAPAR